MSGGLCRKSVCRLAHRIGACEKIVISLFVCDIIINVVTSCNTDTRLPASAGASISMVKCFFHTMYCLWEQTEGEHGAVSF